LGDDFFEVGAFDFLEAGACLVLGDLAAAEAFEVGLTFEVGFAPVASFLGDTLLEGRFFALVAALGADFFAVVDLTVAFEAVDLTALDLVVVVFFAFTLAAAVFAVALGATAFLVPNDLALVTLEEEPLGARGFLTFAFTPVAFLIVVVLGVGLAFSLAEVASEVLGASLIFPEGPLGNENTFLSAPVLIALFKEEMTCALTSILYLISRNFLTEALDIPVRSLESMMASFTISMKGGWAGGLILAVRGIVESIGSGVY